VTDREQYTPVTRADAAEVLEYTWGDQDMRWELKAFGWGHATDAVDQRRSPLHLDGCGGVEHLFRRSGSISQRNSESGASSAPRPWGSAAGSG
jgi:hypothetical protein